MAGKQRRLLTPPREFADEEQGQLHINAEPWRVPEISGLPPTKRRFRRTCCGLKPFNTFVAAAVSTVAVCAAGTMMFCGMLYARAIETLNQADGDLEKTNVIYSFIYQLGCVTTQLLTPEECQEIRP